MAMYLYVAFGAVIWVFATPRRLLSLDSEVHVALVTIAQNTYPHLIRPYVDYISNCRLVQSSSALRDATSKSCSVNV